MAKLGDFGKLPVELRKEIFSHLLVERGTENEIDIVRCWPKSHTTNTNVPPGLPQIARRGHRRNPQHRGQKWDVFRRVWVTQPPSKFSLLRASKAVSVEAAEVLYGCNTFGFEDSSVLVGFLLHIGRFKRHLRHIVLYGDILVRRLWNLADRWIAILAQTKSLRTLQFSGTYILDCENKVNMHTLIQHCKPVLAALKAVFDARNLNYSVLNVITFPFMAHLHWTSEQCPPGCPIGKQYRDLITEMKKEATEQLQLADG